MAKVLPFQALRFSDKAGVIGELTCPPYDIISEQQRQAFLTRNPHNIIRLELPRDGENPYAAAEETLNQWLQDGILCRDEQAAYYIYEIVFTSQGLDGALPDQRRSVAGLVARVGLQEFSEGVILPHEETLSKAKADRFDLMCATNCNFSSVYCLYNDTHPNGPLDLAALAASGTLLSSMTDEQGLEHRLWAVTDPETVAAIQARFTDLPLTIADGHHRYETALNYRRWRRENGGSPQAADSIMMMLVEMSHPGLQVLPTHRLIRNVPDFDAATLLERSAEYFDILPNQDVAGLAAFLEKSYAMGKKAFGFYTGANKAAFMTLKDESVMAELLPSLSAVSQQLDVTVLHTLVLERLLGIDRENMANQTCLTYTRSLSEALEQVDGGDYQCAFLLNPTRVEEIRDVAAAGEKMPQKSTYFYPKLITGLTMNRLDD